MLYPLVDWAVMPATSLSVEIRRIAYLLHFFQIGKNSWMAQIIMNKWKSVSGLSGFNAYKYCLKNEWKGNFDVISNGRSKKALLLIVSEPISQGRL